MSKLSEPVAKPLQALLTACNGDTKIVSRVITGNYSADNYTFHLISEIKLLRSIPHDSIVLALAEIIIASSDAPKATEQPSAAEAVEGLEGILTEEELKRAWLLIGTLSIGGACEFTDSYAIKLLETAESYASLLAANAVLKNDNALLEEVGTELEQKVSDQNEEICRLQDELSKLRGENE